MRTPTITQKLPASIQTEIQTIRAEFGVPSERQTVAACIATVAHLMRDGSLQRLVAYQQPATEQE
jgi:hypothetical protein